MDDVEDRVVSRATIERIGLENFTGMRYRQDVKRGVAAVLIAVLTVLPAFMFESPTFAGAVTTRSPSSELVLSGVNTTHVVPGALPVLPWPKRGQSAVAVRGIGLIGSTPNEHSVPIASLTKIMTAVIVLHDHPLSLNQSGPTISVSADDVADYENEQELGDSTVRVVLGERLTEYQLLEALLVPSGDNIADLLAVWDAGSVAKFVAKMNAMTQTLGLSSTHYGDASGVSPASASTASDQAKLTAVLMGRAVVRSIVRRPRIAFPVVGSFSNFNPALGKDGIIGVKSGWTSEANSCLVTAAFRQVDQRPVLVISVTLGQQGGLIAPARVDEALLTTASRDLFGYRIVDPGATISIRGSTSNVTILEPRASHVVIAWHGLKLNEKVIRKKGLSRSKLANEPNGANVGKLQVLVPWGIVETLRLTNMVVPATTTTISTVSGN